MGILSKVVSGKTEKPHYCLLYGEPGVGKSTFAAKAPNPIFLCSEDGADEIGVSRLKINSYQELIDTLKELTTENHDYKTIVLDTVDHFERLVFEVVCRDEKKKSIDDIGYAKGYIYALEYWAEVVALLEKARNDKNINIILLAHSIIKAHNDPQLDAPYDTYQIKMHHKAAELLRDRVSCVLFATYKTYLHEKESGKNKGIGDGTRIVYTEKRPAFLAKNRYNLPFELPLDWDDFDRASKSHSKKDSASIIKFIEENLFQLDSAVREKAEKHFNENKNNPEVLSQIENRIKAIISTKTA